MPSHLYRFRPLDRLLDKDELLNQEIYFASPAELNDPMEGFRDIVWQGDAVLWSNLFRHYVQCLEWACSLLVIGGEDRPITWDNIPVVTRGDISPTPHYAAKLNKILDQILGDAHMQAVIAALASRTIPVRRSELTALLDIVHLFALAAIDRTYPRSGAVHDTADLAELRGALRQARLMAENAAKLEAQTPNPELVLPALFDAQAHTFAEMHFIHRYNGAILPNQPNRNFVLLSFPDEYVRQIEALVYPPWYAACFMQDCSNPAIWGTYGDGHRNVCLRFKVRDKSGVPILRLRAKVGWSSRQKRTTQDWSQSFHAHRLPPLGRIGIVSPTDARDGVVDEDVHSAEPGHDRGTRVLDPPRVSDVDRHRKDGTVARCDRRRVASGRVEIKAGQHNRHPASANRLHIARRCRALRR